MPTDKQPQSPIRSLTTTPPPVSSLSAPWRGLLTLPHTPICPICADRIDAHSITIYRNVAFCSPCGSRARATNWPEPFDMRHIFDGPDLMFAAGVGWYHPNDNRPETAFARRVRIDSEHTPPIDV